MTTYDARQWSKLNMWRLPSQELCVRPGLRRIFTPSAGRVLVGGFSVSNQFTGEQWHYVFDAVIAGTKALRLLIMDEDFQVFESLQINADMIPRVITHAVVEGQIIIASPDFPTLWGLVGSGVRRAVKVASDNPSTTAINVPRGICSAWCNRVVIADGNSLFFSDPVAATGGDTRTYVAENQNQRPGIVFGIHEGAGGMLVVSTNSGVYGLDSAAAAVGIIGSNGTDWRLLNHQKSISFSSTATVRGRVFGLTRLGYILVDEESTEEQALTEPVQPRAFGPRISIEDYRACRIYAGSDGPIVAADVVNAVFMTDLAHQKMSWWRSSHSPTSFVLKDMLQEPDGSPLMLCTNGIFRFDGNFDGEVALSSGVNPQPKGSLFSVLPVSPSMSETVRHVHVGAEQGGNGAIYAALRGAIRVVVPAVDEQGLTIGADSWGTNSKRYTTTPVTDARLAFGPMDSSAQRDIGIEVATDGCMTRMMPTVDVDMSESAPKRPTNTAELMAPSIEDIDDQVGVTTIPFTFTPTTDDGGSFTLSYALLGTLPAGLSFSTSNGAITGTPTVAGVTVGLTIVLTYTGPASGVVYSNSFNLTVYSIPTIATISDQNADINVPFFFAPTVGNLSSLTLAFSIVGTLPTGLSINTGTGAITGTPTVNQVVSGLKIRITYSGPVVGTVDSNTFMITVASEKFLFVGGNVRNSPGATAASIGFDSITLASSNGSNSIRAWLAKVDTTTQTATWATKICENGQASSIFGPYVAANVTTGDVFASFCTGATIGTQIHLFSAGSDAIVQSFTTTTDIHVFLLKYNLSGVLQWARMTRFTTSQPGHLCAANAPNLCLLPSGNVVMSCQVKTGSAGGTELSTTITLFDGSTDTNAATFTVASGGQPEQGCLIEVDPAGAFVSSKLSEVTNATGESHFPYVLSDIGTWGIAAGHQRTRGAAMRLGVGEANEYTQGPTGILNNRYCHFAKYNTAKLFQWTAADIDAADPYDLGQQPFGCELDSTGAVYGTSGTNLGTSEVNKRVDVTSKDWTTPTTTVPIIQTVANAVRPIYSKRNAAGATLWAKGYGAATVYGDATPRPIGDVAVVNDIPWIVGVVRQGAGESLVLDQGLSSQQILVGDVAPFTRAFVAKLNPSDGTITAITRFSGTTGQQTFGVDIDNAEGTGKKMDAVFCARAMDTTKIAIGLDYIDSPLTIGATTLTPAAGKSQAPFAVLDTAGGVVFAKLYPSSGQDSASIHRISSVSSGKV